MKPRRRKNDSPEVKALFDLHDKLNDNGTHWIKGAMRRAMRISGKRTTCWCLAGGINSVTRKHQMRHALRVMIAKVLPSRFYATGRSPENSIIGFNDDPRTTWNDVEKVIYDAIIAERANAQ